MVVLAVLVCRGFQRHSQSAAEHIGQSSDRVGVRLPGYLFIIPVIFLARSRAFHLLFTWVGDWLSKVTGTSVFLPTELVSFFACLS
jgi:hypothetical protein